MSIAPNEPQTDDGAASSHPGHGPEPDSVRSRCILILGMHRSGTSALTRVVNLFGADLSEGLIPPKPSNVTGFWEAQSIFQIHNELLKSFGLMWHDYLPLPRDWEKSAAALEARNKLVEYLQAEFSASRLFAVKDPRLCRLLPLWLDALKEFGAEPLFLFCYRSPLEVAASLYARDQIPWDTSLHLWIRSYLEAEAATRNHRRLFMAYDDLMRDWRPVMKAISASFDIDWTRPFEEAEPDVDSFLSDSHRHHTEIDFELVDDRTTRQLLRAMYAALQEDRSRGGSALQEFSQRASAHLEEKSGLFGPVLKYERNAQFQLQTEKARAQRFNRRLQWKLDQLQKRSKMRKRRMNIVWVVSVASAVLLGAIAGYGLTRLLQ